MKKAFIALYAKNHKPWKNLIYLKETDREKSVSVILILSRWDGFVGFPGGYVEESESPVAGVIRETEEETGYIIEGEVEEICKDRDIYFYAKEIEMEELISIQKKMPNAIDYGSEILGSTLMYIGNYKNSFDTFMSYPFIGKAKEQLKLLIEKKNL